MNNRKFNSVNSKKIYKLIIIRTLVCVCVHIEFYDNNNEAGRTLFCYFRKIEKDEWIRMKNIMFNVH